MLWGLPTWYAPSTDPVVEKAQHEPQPPWFFTGVTAPLVRQSMAPAFWVVSSVTTLRSESGFTGNSNGDRACTLNSAALHPGRRSCQR